MIRLNLSAAVEHYYRVLLFPVLHLKLRFEADSAKLLWTLVSYLARSLGLSLERDCISLI